jgi:NAD(P)H-dependent FMN reductase
MWLYPPKILVLDGSLRKEIVSRKLASEVGRILASYGVDAKVFDLTYLPIFLGDVDKTPKMKELLLSHVM